MFLILCNASGETMCGTDGHLRVDGRLSSSRYAGIAKEYRERFRKHFAYKTEFWTHYFASPRIDGMPSKVLPIV